MKRKKTVGVALSGGGVTGYFFEAGSIRALLDCGIPIDKISGVSAGAAVAALVAHEIFPDEHNPFEHIKLDYIKNLGRLSIIPYGLLGVVLTMGPKKYKESVYELCFKAPKSLVDLSVIENFFSNILQECAPKPYTKDLYITATNLDSGKQRVFTRADNVARAVRASCSFPGLGSPTIIDGNYYVDGILSCIANVEAISEADIIICINPITFNCMDPGFFHDRGIFKILEQSFRIINSERLSHDMRKIVDEMGKELILIEPKDCSIMSSNPMRMNLRLEALQSGYDHTIDKLHETEAILHKAGVQVNWPKSLRLFR